MPFYIDPNDVNCYRPNETTANAITSREQPTPATVNQWLECWFEPDLGCCFAPSSWCQENCPARSRAEE